MGLNLKYGSIKKYMKFVRESWDRHQAFTRSLKKFIQVHNRDPEQMRLRCRNELETAQTVDSVKATGKRFIKPSKTFVLVEDYRDQYGPAPSDKVKIEEEDVDGSGVQSGVWLEGAIRDRKGHYVLEDYFDKHVDHNTRIEDGQNVLTKAIRLLFL